MVGVSYGRQRVTGSDEVAGSAGLRRDKEDKK
jgi:hypothetical protein